jgi:hypothetical protein
VDLSEGLDIWPYLSAWIQANGVALLLDPFPGSKRKARDMSWFLGLDPSERYECHYRSIASIQANGMSVTIDPLRGSKHTV